MKKHILLTIAVMMSVIASAQSDLNTYEYKFENATLQGWTTIDADGDGYNWEPSIADDVPLVYSASYDNSLGELTPDNYLVSPKIKLDGSIEFYARAQDAKYPEEHFGVFVSTKSNTDPADFECLQEWTLTSAPIRRIAVQNAPARRIQGNWYLYKVDLSGYGGQDGYVAIRHFDCTDQYRLQVNNITLKSSYLYPSSDMEVAPMEGMLEALNMVTITFNYYDVELVNAATAEAILFNDINEFHAPISVVDGNKVVAMFDNITVSGEYTLRISRGTLRNTTTNELVNDIELNYSIYPRTPVTLPEGLTPETWYIHAEGKPATLMSAEVAVAIDGNDIYIQGFSQEYLPEAWVKGTIDGFGHAIIQASQYLGKYSNDNGSCNIWFVGSTDGNTISDVVLEYDADAGSLTLEDGYIVINASPVAIAYYEYYYDVEISRGANSLYALVAAPEDLVTSEYEMVAHDTYFDKEVSRTVLVGRYGDNEVYIQGLSDAVPEAWVKGTIDADGVVTIPATYLGIYHSFFDGDLNVTADATTLKYDATTNTYTCEAFISRPKDGDAYDELDNLILRVIVETVATPVNPEVTKFVLYTNDTKTKYTSYPWIAFNIPTTGTDGSELLKDKLSYVIYITDAAGVEKPLTLTTELYVKIDEDMTEIPYRYDDGYDISIGESHTIYLNQDKDEIASWRKIGVQSIYRGLGVTRRSDIVWNDGTVTEAVQGEVDDVNGDNSVDTQDVLAIYGYMQTNQGSLSTFDVNGDGIVDTQDVLHVYGVMQSAVKERR